MKKPSQEDIQKALDTCYEKSLHGIQNVSKPVTVMMDEYLDKYSSKDEAIKKFLKVQLLKCSTSGFVTGFGGVLTLPISIPANVSSVLYVQIRMISALAYASGLNLNSDEVQTFVYACLAGVSLNNVAKQFGIKFGNKLVLGTIKKIPGKTLTKINQKVGFRLLTKFGETGLINLGKCIPVVGAGICAGFDYAETKVIAARAYKWFIKGNLD